MCRSIKRLYNLEPPATKDEIREASLQYVRKISGINHPSVINRATFLTAVDAISIITRDLLATLDTSTPPRTRAEEAALAKARLARRIAAHTGAQ